jgi:hypothetical protein
MSNSYYTPPTDVAALTRARSGDINLRDDAVDAAFDKVPDEAKLKRGTVNYAVTGGAANAYTAALAYVPSGYVDGLLINAYIHANNTGASTVNVNSLGVKSIKLQGGGEPLAGDLQKFVDLRYSTTTGFFHVQGNTAGSVSDAAASAAAAAASASAASSSASSASSSAASAAASYDSFDDRYLGPKASDPTLDNDGNALLTGALYFNTTVNIMRIYTGSAWLASTASAVNVAFTPAGTIAATNVQAAIEELGTEKAQLTDLAASSGAGLVGVIAAGAGAVARTVQDKERDIVSTLDYPTGTGAVTSILSAGTGTLVVPNNASVTLPASFSSTVVDYQSQTAQNVYAESESGRLAKRLLKTQHGTHSGTQQVSVWGLEHRPLGSGFNGAANSDIGVNLSVIKQSYLTSTVQGEIDGLNVVVRQGGPTGNGSTTNSDCAGILVDVGIKTGSGFAAAYEGSTAVFDSAGVTLRQVQTQVGVLDTTIGLYIGFVGNVSVGNMDDGIRLLSSGTGSYTNFLTFKNIGGVNIFQVDGFGRLRIAAPSGVTPSKTIRSLNGALSVLNDAQNVEIFSLDDTGNMNTSGGYTAGGGITGPQLIINSGATTAAAGTIRIGATTATTVGAAGGASALPATPLGYININVAGTPAKIPYYTA